MSIGDIALLAVGFGLGVCFAAWMVQEAGYAWSEVIRRWQVGVVLRVKRKRWERELG